MRQGESRATQMFRPGRGPSLSCTTVRKEARGASPTEQGKGTKYRPVPVEQGLPVSHPVELCSGWLDASIGGSGRGSWQQTHAGGSAGRMYEPRVQLGSLRGWPRQRSTEGHSNMQRHPARETERLRRGQLSQD